MNVESFVVRCTCATLWFFAIQFRVFAQVTYSSSCMFFKHLSLRSLNACCTEVLVCPIQLTVKQSIVLLQQAWISVVVVTVGRPCCTNSKYHFPQWQWFCIYLSMSGSVDLIAAKQDLESSWHLFFIKHTHTQLLIHFVCAWCRHAHFGSEKTKQNLLHITPMLYKSNLTWGRHDGSDDSISLQLCQSVPPSPQRGCGSSLLILESRGECLNCCI